MTCIDRSRPWVELGHWPNDEEGEKQARLSAAEHTKQMRQLKAVGALVRSRGRAVLALAELGEATDAMRGIVDAYLDGGAS